MQESRLTNMVASAGLARPEQSHAGDNEADMPAQQATEPRHQPSSAESAEPRVPDTQLGKR